MGPHPARLIRDKRKYTQIADNWASPGHPAARGAEAHRIPGSLMRDSHGVAGRSGPRREALPAIVRTPLRDFAVN